MTELLLHAPEAAAAIAAAVVVPQGVWVIDEPDRRGRRSPLLVAARRLALPASLGVVAAFLLSPGWSAALLVAPYAAVALLVALHGAARLVGRGLAPASEVGLGAGMVFLGGAAVWLCAHRAGVSVMGYPPYWVALTASHFHIAGFALPVIAGLYARGRGAVAALAVWLVVLGVPATAIGIAWSRPIELGAGLATATGGALVGGLALASTRRAAGSLRLLHAAAGAALLVSMPLAAAYALRLDLRIGGLSALDTMAASHGALNLGFAVVALAALGRARPRPDWARGLPLSALSSGGRVGADHFERTGAALAGAVTPRGQLDRLDDLAHPGFDPAAVAPAIRRFYEHTADHVLIVHPRWRLGARLAARIWGAVARRLGQLELPLADKDGDERVASRLVALDPARDGRTAPRGWIRTYQDGRPMFVAAYATHAHDGVGYLNIAFPLPWAQLTSILRFDHLAGGAIVVSSRRAGRRSDAGTWLVLRPGQAPLPVRVPIDEEVRMWTPSMSGIPDDLRVLATPTTTALARHDIWVAGVRIVTLDYVISAPRSSER